MEWYDRKLRNEMPASESLSQIRDCNKVHSGFNNPIMLFLCVISYHKCGSGSALPLGIWTLQWPVKLHVLFGNIKIQK